MQTTISKKLCTADKIRVDWVTHQGKQYTQHAYQPLSNIAVKWSAIRATARMQPLALHFFTWEMLQLFFYAMPCQKITHANWADTIRCQRNCLRKWMKWGTRLVDSFIFFCLQWHANLQHWVKSMPHLFNIQKCLEIQNMIPIKSNGFAKEEM